MKYTCPLCKAEIPMPLFAIKLNLRATCLVIPKGLRLPDAQVTLLCPKCKGKFSVEWPIRIL